MKTLDEKTNEIASNLNIPEDWTKRFLSQIEWGLDSIQALSMLDGLAGSVNEPCPDPEWIWDLDPNLQSVDWNRGYVQVLAPSGTRKMKLGKWLRKVNATKEQVREFETRKLSTWEFKISTTSEDVVTMSYGRAWTSCMRPFELHQEGLFSDMKSGTAVLFWYRPGADRPCGRELIRPGVNRAGNLVGIRPGVVYGNGPDVADQTLQELIDFPVITASTRGYKGIFACIYDDLAREDRAQTIPEINENASLLREAKIEVDTTWEEWDYSHSSDWGYNPDFMSERETAKWLEEVDRIMNESETF